MSNKRTDAIRAAISAIDTEMQGIETKRRELLYAVGEPGDDPLGGVNELTELSAKMTALHQRRAGLDDLLEQARAHDRVLELKEKQGQILQHVANGCEALEKRIKLGAKVDAMISDLGTLLHEVQATNVEASKHFSDAMRMTPAEPTAKGDLRTIIGDYVSGRALGGALASKLRAHGVGEVGIVADVIWNGTSGADETVAEAMGYAKQKVETTFGYWLAARIEGLSKPEPMPSRLPANMPKHWSEMTPQESHAAAIAAAGQGRDMALDDFDLSDEEKEGLRGHIDANGAGGTNVRVNGHRVDARTTRKPKGRA